jgi:hypothetical protein
MSATDQNPVSGEGEQNKAAPPKPGGDEVIVPGWRMSDNVSEIKDTSATLFIVRDGLEFYKNPFKGLSLTWLVELQQPPRPFRFCTVESNILLQDQSSFGYWEKGYHFRQDIPIDVRRYIGNQLCAVLDGIVVPLVLGIQPREADNIDMRSTSSADEAEIFSHHMTFEERKSLPPKNKPYELKEVEPDFQINATLRNLRYPGWDDEHLVHSGTVKLVKLRAAVKPPAVNIGPQDTTKQMFYFCSREYLADVKLGYERREALVVGATWMEDIFTTMGYTLQNFPNRSTFTHGAYSGRTVMVGPMQLSRPFLSEDAVIRDVHEPVLANDVAVPAVFTMGKANAFSIIPGNKFADISEAVSAFSVGTTESAYHQHFLINYLLRGRDVRMIVPVTTEKFKLVIQYAFLFMQIPCIGVGINLHVDMCTKLASVFGIPTLTPEASLRPRARDAAWAIDKGRAVKALIEVVRDINWTQVAVRRWVQGPRQYVYVPTHIILAFKAHFGDAPFGPVTTERISKMSAVIATLSTYYATLRQAFMKYLRAHVKHDNQVPVKGTLFSREYIIQELHFYMELVRCAEESWSTKMMYDSADYFSSFEYNGSAVAPAVYPCTDGQKYIPNGGGIGELMSPPFLKMEPVTSICEKLYDVYMEEVFYVVSSVMFRAPNCADDFETFAYATLYVFSHLVGEAVGARFTVHKELFPASGVKRLPVVQFCGWKEDKFWSKFLERLSFLHEIFTRIPALLTSTAANDNFVLSMFRDNRGIIRSYSHLRVTESVFNLRSNTLRIYVPFAERGVVKVNASQVTLMFDRVIESFSEKTLMIRVAGNMIGQKIAPVRADIVVNAPTYIKSITVIEHQQDVSNFITCAPVKIYRGITQGYSFYIEDFVFPLMRSGGFGGVPPVIIDKWISDSEGRLLVPLAKVTPSIGRIVYSRSNDVRSTMDGVFVDGAVLAELILVNIGVTIPLFMRIEPILGKNPITILES